MGQKLLAPGGPPFGYETPKTNATSLVRNAPQSPTPPGFPFGLPGGSYAPGGAATSGPEIGFQAHR